MKRLLTVLILGLASLSPAMAQDPEHPKVTASEVVDRETLKAFVETGKEYLRASELLPKPRNCGPSSEPRGIGNPAPRSSCYCSKTVPFSCTGAMPQ